MNSEKPSRWGSNVLVCLAGTLCFAVNLSAAQRKPVGRAGAVREADWLVAQLAGTRWDSAYSSWAAQHPSTACLVFHGDGSFLFLVDQWAYRCTNVTPFGRASDFFYILDPATTPEIGLEEFQAEIVQAPGMPISVMQRIHDRIESLLTQQYGKPDAPDTVPAAVAAWGSGDWQLVRVWPQPDRDICLYLRNSPGQPVVVGVLARDHALVLASVSEGTQLLLNTEPAAAYEDRIDNRLASDLKPGFPLISSLLGDAGQQPSLESTLDTVASTIRGAQKQPPDRRAELLLAADRLLAHARLPGSHELPGAFQTRFDSLKTLAGLQFSWDELGGTWTYHHDLLWTIWQNYPQTEWGQDAFFLLLETGWDTSGVCQAGADQFRMVIRQGDKFLVDFPASPARLPVMYLVALANETWWSLSQWSSCSPVTDFGTKPCAPMPESASYQNGAATAREDALQEYKALLAADPDTYGIPEIRRSLARLELGIDTNQRRFYCLYD